jgi:hypothetical protein
MDAEDYTCCGLERGIIYINMEIFFVSRSQADRLLLSIIFTRL